MTRTARPVLARLLSVLAGRPAWARRALARLGLGRQAEPSRSQPAWLSRMETDRRPKGALAWRPGRQRAGRCLRRQVVHPGCRTPAFSLGCPESSAESEP